jgi:hypothetical protein
MINEVGKKKLFYMLEIFRFHLVMPLGREFMRMANYLEN